jgi:hypothetical protein
VEKRFGEKLLLSSAVLPVQKSYELGIMKAGNPGE